MEICFRSHSRRLFWTVLASALASVAFARAEAPLSGSPFTLSAAGLEMLPIPAGAFVMGSRTDEPGRGPSESPQTRIVISKPFWLSKTVVTHAQWKRVMGTDLVAQASKALLDDTLYPFGERRQTLRGHWGLARTADPRERVGNTEDDLPMQYVSWDEAVEFCRKLTGQAHQAGTLPKGYEYSLPTEAQWEYACRAGTTTATYAGPIQILGQYNAPVLDAIAWYGGNSSAGYQGKGWDTGSWAAKEYPGGKAGPRDVGLKQPNAWGLYDMLGDVMQWCRDWYGPYAGGTVTDPSGAASGTLRVLRGASWFVPADRCRSARRDGDPPGYRNYSIGIRLALSPITD